MAEPKGDQTGGPSLRPQSSWRLRGEAGSGLGSPRLTLGSDLEGKGDTDVPDTLLSPQWLLNKPGEGKTSAASEFGRSGSLNESTLGRPAVGGGNDVGGKERWREGRDGGAGRGGVSDEKRQWWRDRDAPANGRKDRWGEDERDVVARPSRDRWGKESERGEIEPPQRTAERLPMGRGARWQEGPPKGEPGEYQRGGDRWETTKGGFEPKRDSKWGGPRDRWASSDEKDHFRRGGDRWADSEKEGENSGDRAKEGDREADRDRNRDNDASRNRAWRPQSFAGRGRGEAPPGPSQIVGSPGKYADAGPTFGRGRGRGGGGGDSASYAYGGRGRGGGYGAANAPHPVPPAPIGAPPTPEKPAPHPPLPEAAAAEGGLKYSRTRLLEIYKAVRDSPSMKKLPEGFVEVEQLTSLEPLDPLGLQAPDATEQALIEAIQKGEVTSSGAVHGPPKEAQVAGRGRKEGFAAVGRGRGRGRAQGAAAVVGKEDAGFDAHREDDFFDAPGFGDLQGGDGGAFDRLVEARFADADHAGAGAGANQGFDADGGHGGGKVGGEEASGRATWRKPGEDTSHSEGAWRPRKTGEDDGAAARRDGKDAQAAAGAAAKDGNSAALAGAEKAPGGAGGTPSSGVGKVAAQKRLFRYKDPQGDVQGPFWGDQLMEWFDAGYFGLDLLVCPVDSPEGAPFARLADVMPHLKPKAAAPPGFAAAAPAAAESAPAQAPSKDEEAAPAPAPALAQGQQQAGVMGASPAQKARAGAALAPAPTPGTKDGAATLARGAAAGAGAATPLAESITAAASSPDVQVESLLPALLGLPDARIGSARRRMSAFPRVDDGEDADSRGGIGLAAAVASPLHLLQGKEPGLLLSAATGGEGLGGAGSSAAAMHAQLEQPAVDGLRLLEGLLGRKVEEAHVKSGGPSPLPLPLQHLPGVNDPLLLQHLRQQQQQQVGGGVGVPPHLQGTLVEQLLHAGGLPEQQQQQGSQQQLLDQYMRIQHLAQHHQHQQQHQQHPHLPPQAFFHEQLLRGGPPPPAHMLAAASFEQHLLGAGLGGPQQGQPQQQGQAQVPSLADQLLLRQPGGGGGGLDDRHLSLQQQQQHAFALEQQAQMIMRQQQQRQQQQQQEEHLAAQHSQAQGNRHQQPPPPQQQQLLQQGFGGGLPPHQLLEALQQQQQQQQGGGGLPGQQRMLGVWEMDEYGQPHFVQQPQGPPASQAPPQQPPQHLHPGAPPGSGLPGAFPEFLAQQQQQLQGLSSSSGNSAHEPNSGAGLPVWLRDAKQDPQQQQQQPQQRRQMAEDLIVNGPEFGGSDGNSNSSSRPQSGGHAWGARPAEADQDALAHQQQQQQQHEAHHLRSGGNRPAPLVAQLPQQQGGSAWGLPGPQGPATSASAYPAAHSFGPGFGPSPTPTSTPSGAGPQHPVWRPAAAPKPKSLMEIQQEEAEQKRREQAEADAAARANGGVPPGTPTAAGPWGAGGSVKRSLREIQEEEARVAAAAAAAGGRTPGRGDIGGAPWGGGSPTPADSRAGGGKAGLRDVMAEEVIVSVTSRAAAAAAVTVGATPEKQAGGGGRGSQTPTVNAAAGGGAREAPPTTPQGDEGDFIEAKDSKKSKKKGAKGKAAAAAAAAKASPAAASPAAEAAALQSSALAKKEERERQQQQQQRGADEMPPPPGPAFSLADYLHSPQEAGADSPTPVPAWAVTACRPAAKLSLKEIQEAEQRARELAARQHQALEQQHTQAMAAARPPALRSPGVAGPWMRPGMPSPPAFNNGSSSPANAAPLSIQQIQHQQHFPAPSLAAPHAHAHLHQQHEVPANARPKAGPAEQTEDDDDLFWDYNQDVTMTIGGAAKKQPAAAAALPERQQYPALGGGKASGAAGGSARGQAAPSARSPAVAAPAATASMLRQQVAPPQPAAAAAVSREFPSLAAAAPAASKTASKGKKAAAASPAPASAPAGVQESYEVTAGQARQAGASASEGKAFRQWCETNMRKLTGSDDMTLLEFCMSLSAREAGEYLTEYLGSSAAVAAFKTELLHKKATLGVAALRTAFPVSDAVVRDAEESAGRAGSGITFASPQGAAGGGRKKAADDETGDDAQSRAAGAGGACASAAGAKKKGKKAKKAVDPSLLGFSVQSNRIMVGEIQRVEDL